MKEMQKQGRTSRSYSASESDRIHSSEGWTQIPSFVILQRGGKKRMISNANGRQNTATAIDERIGLCNALSPTLLVCCFVSFFMSDTVASGEIRAYESGTDDMPDAYQSLLDDPHGVPFNVVEFADQASGQFATRLHSCFSLA